MNVKDVEDASERMEYLKYLIPFILINSMMYTVAKDSLNYSQPFIFMSLRFAVASSIFYLSFRNSVTLPNKDMILLGLFSAASGAAWLLGLNYVSASDSAVLSYTMPFFAIPLSYKLLKEKIRVGSLIGAILGISGVIIYSETLPLGQSTFLGVALTLVNAFFYALFTVYYRKLRGVMIGNVLFWQCFVSLVVFLPLSVIRPRIELTQNFIIDVAFVSVMGGAIMFYAWSTLARKENIGKLAALVYLVPVMTMVYEFLLYGHLPTFFALCGAVVMIFGVYVSRYYKI